LSKRVAEDTGVQLIPIYTGSLSGPDGPASTYLDFMRYNVDAIVKAAQQ
jgi:ABC-type Zn uptake system ZnuABC Zn-binding protein ZnuA